MAIKEVGSWQVRCEKEETLRVTAERPHQQRQTSKHSTLKLLPGSGGSSKQHATQELICFKIQLAPLASHHELSAERVHGSTSLGTPEAANCFV